MGKAARFACILLPMLCTLASLIIVIILGVAGTNAGSMKMLQDYYLFQVDTRNLTIPTDNKSIQDQLQDSLLDKIGFGKRDEEALALARRADEGTKVDIEDFYDVYLWSHCWGTVEKDDDWKLKDCTKPKFLKYRFDMQKVVNEHNENDKDEANFGDAFKDVQGASDAVYKAMGACYALGALGTAITFVVGWFGLLSRWGSCITLIFADAAFIFLLAASVMATVVSKAYKGAFKEVFDEFGVAVKVGPRFIPATWVLVAFSFASALFWMFSSCCCSGRTRKVMEDGKRAPNAPVHQAAYPYERVASPYHGAGTPLQPYGGAPKSDSNSIAKEPMRHQVNPYA